MLNVEIYMNIHIEYMLYLHQQHHYADGFGRHKENEQ
jgi:hypothetical protein